MSRAEYTPPPFEPDIPHVIEGQQTRIFVGAGVASKALHGEDAGFAIPEKGAFALCDGVSGAHEAGQNPNGPRIAAQVGSRILCDLAARMPIIDTPLEATDWAEDVMHAASQQITQQGGTVATALVLGITTNRAGHPHVIVGSRGDSRAVSYPQLPQELRGETIQHLSDAVDRTGTMKWLAQEALRRRLKDGTCDYELFTDTSDRGPRIGKTTSGQADTTARYIPLAYNQRHRFVLASDGIFGKDEHAFMPRHVVAYGMSHGRPSQAAAYFERHSKTRDDRLVYVIDVGAQRHDSQA